MPLRQRLCLLYRTGRTYGAAGAYWAGRAQGRERPYGTAGTDRPGRRHGGTGTSGSTGADGPSGTGRSNRAYRSYRPCRPYRSNRPPGTGRHRRSPGKDRPGGIYRSQGRNRCNRCNRSHRPYGRYWGNRSPGHTGRTGAGTGAELCLIYKYPVSSHPEQYDCPVPGCHRQHREHSPDRFAAHKPCSRLLPGVLQGFRYF